MKLDPKHESFDLFSDQIIQDIWREKYAQPNERTPSDTFLRVADFVYSKDGAGSTPHLERAYEAMCKGLWMPGGRILAGAGTGTDVTLMNCYVCRDIEDSIQGINAAMGDAMTTLSKYGGIGMNFGTIRPSGASINRVGLKAPGPIVFMELWNSMSNTIMQAGHRRGAMMAVMPDWHPDVLNFINAKHEKGKLTNFNISVLISNAFMRAVAQDADWDLYFHVPPAQVASSDIKCVTIQERTQYVYATHKARWLWDQILQSTHKYSEPGVIFIDRVNALNNLQYCETIACTNPCGEQPLPPNGTCNLGAVNLARMVRDPYSESPRFNFSLLKEVVAIGTRFLDNVIEVTHYPLQEQKEEEFNKRRLGLGVSGLADMLAQLRIPYNSSAAVHVTTMVIRQIAETAYATSAKLAQERGSFPLFDGKLLDRGFTLQLPVDVRQTIRECGGLRNGVLLTVAPTGTTSILFGNISSGIEPVFQHHTKRKVWTSNTETKEYVSYGFGARFYQHCIERKTVRFPEYMVTGDQVELLWHLRIQAAAQEWVDASISKTINCPADIAYEDFKQVYADAFDSGCKGCTTYTPSDVRGAVLEKVEDEPEAEEPPAGLTPIVDVPKAKTSKRPEVLMGCTYRINWPSLESGVYLTINECEGQPWEIFISSKDLKNVEWTTALCIMTSRNLRAGEDPQKIAEELKEIKGAHDGQWVNGKYYASIVMYIGELLAKHFQYLGTEDRHLSAGSEIASGDGYPRQDSLVDGIPTIREAIPFTLCPKCSARMVKSEGCEKCTSCSYSKCG